jgi:hypothetical protein
MKTVKLTGVFAITILLATSCGPSEEEKEQSLFDSEIKGVCDCYEENQHDWLTYRTDCVEKSNEVWNKYKDTEHKEELSEKLSECDQWHKE